MTGFASLVALYLRDLSRRRLLWGLVLVTAAVVAVNYWTTELMSEAVSEGETWHIATRQAASRLDGLMTFLRPWFGFVVVLLAAQLAPESRRNGTTQFVLALGIRRNVLAAAQFVALGIVVTIAVVIVHSGFSVAGLNTGSLNSEEIAVSWLSLLLPSLTAAASVFALSLTTSALECYLVFLGIPFLTRVIPNAIRGLPRALPLPILRAIENLTLLFPEFDELVTWPRLTFRGGGGTPLPQWHWPLAHLLFAAAFWVALGIWLQARHDFGSRTALK